MVEKLEVEIGLVGGAQVKKELADVTQSFNDATKSIAALGTTGAEALDSASAAAQKFGASAADLQKVNSVINSLASRSRDSSTSFSQLAKNYDNARSAAASFVSGSAKVEEATKNTGTAMRETHAAITALAGGLRGLGLGGLASEISAIGRIGGAFGPAGIALAAIGVAIAGVGAALVKFAVDASETEKSLTQLQKVSGVSFQNLSALQQVFAAGGTPLAKFAQEFGNLSEKIAAAGQQAAIRRADKDTVQWANDFDIVRRKFDNLASGGRVTFSVLTTMDTKVQALLESLAKVSGSEAQWRKLADIFKNLGSDLERAQLGKALGLSPESIATLSQGSAKMKELAAAAGQLGLTLTDSNQKALQEMAAQWNQFMGLLSAFFPKIGALAAPAITGILTAFKTAMQGIVADFQNMPLDQAVANMTTRLAPAFSALGDVLSPLLSQIGNALGTALVNGIIAAVKARFAGPPGGTPLAGGAPIGGPGGGIGSNAAGGLLGGRGTGTSDSNLAWVSRGEFITPARAVAQPGVLAFLEALRRSGGNLSAVLDGMGRFALGGMVPRTMPAFASGGLNGGMSNVTIQFPGLPDIGGLRASASTVDELRRAAALAQVRSGGRKPSRYS